MLRAVDRWLPGYLASVMRPERCTGKRHLLFCIADHFEPFDRTIQADGRITGGVSDTEARGLVKDWCGEYRAVLGEFRDADGVAPRHTFFYPWDEYEEGCVEQLADFCREGYGEVEVHLHHRNDTEEGLRQKLIACRDTYAGQHGLLGRRSEIGGRRSEVGGRGSEIGGRGSEIGGRRSEIEGGAVYAFVHGNWCLCNGRADGDWCGVDRELAVLAGTGCYADFTFPSAPSDTQPRCVNEIYYGRDPRAGERGVQVGERLKWGKAEMVKAEIRSAEHRTSNIEHRTSNREKCDRGAGGVVMIPGPLGLNWGARKFGVLPGLENGEISGVNPATGQRLRLWSRIGVHVPGRPEWVVVKLHTHGALRSNRKSLTGAAMAQFHRELAQMCTGDDWDLHYVAARELFNIVKAAESGLGGNPGQYRDYEIKTGL